MPVVQSTQAREKAAQLPSVTSPSPATSAPPMAAPGEASTKLLRFLYFAGAGVICTKAINTYRDYELQKEASAALASAEAALSAAAAGAAEPAPASVAAASTKPGSRSRPVSAG